MLLLLIVIVLIKFFVYMVKLGYVFVENGWLNYIGYVNNIY